MSIGVGIIRRDEVGRERRRRSNRQTMTIATIMAPLTAGPAAAAPAGAVGVGMFGAAHSPRPRVDRARQEVDGERHHDGRDGEDQREALNDIVVAAEQRVDHQQAQPGHGIDGLDDDGAADQEGDHDAEQVERRQHRIGQDSAPEDLPLACPLGARGGNEIGRRSFRSARRAGSASAPDQPDGGRQRRQEQMVQMVGEALAVARNRKPAELDAEEARHHDAQPEHRNGTGRQRRSAGSPGRPSRPAVARRRSPAPPSAALPGRRHSR